jgi:hypothetical protein
VTEVPILYQPTDDVRLGVRLTPLKAAIVDRIKAAGDIGVSSDEIIADLYRDRRPVHRNTIKSHTDQINTLLAGGNWRIHSDRRRWFLQKGK